MPDPPLIGHRKVHVGLLSLEPWDQVWRRNQHFASQVARHPPVASLTCVTPPSGGLALRSVRRRPQERVAVCTPPLVVPAAPGGHRVLAAWIRRTLRDVDVLWVNDPVAGVAALHEGLPAVYDVTDDWRCMAQRPADRAWVAAAADVLSVRAHRGVLGGAGPAMVGALRRAGHRHRQRGGSRRAAHRRPPGASRPGATPVVRGHAAHQQARRGPRGRTDRGRNLAPVGAGIPGFPLPGRGYSVPASSCTARCRAMRSRLG